MQDDGSGKSPHDIAEGATSLPMTTLWQERGLATEGANERGILASVALS